MNERAPAGEGSQAALLATIARLESALAHAEQLQQKLRDSSDFTRLAMEAVSGVGVWTYDVATDRFTCDAAIASLYGIDLQEAAAGILRSRFLANVHPDDLAALRKTMSSGLVHSGDLELEYRICHPDGSIRWVYSRGHTYFDEAGKPLRRTGVGVDRSAQRHLEEQLRQAQKMEAVGQLTGGLAHDFNNMLQGIMGPLEMVRRLMTLDETVRMGRYIDMAFSSTQRAATLTHRLLAFSRRQPLAPMQLDANQLVRSMDELLRRTTGPEVALLLALEETPCLIRCDANQLESALLNLAINARDAMPDGGRLTIATSRLALDAAYLSSHPGVAPGAFVCIAVTDTGVGMSPAVVRQVFEPFFTTKPLGQGTGLGLSMVYGFAGQSGGLTDVYSHPGLGTTIRLLLPVDLDEQRSAPETASRRPPSQDGGGRTILVVEDDHAVRQLLVAALGEAGYAVVTASEGFEGLAVLESDAAIDLLVTDVGLPGLNGRQMADAGRLIRPALGVLFMTGYAELASAPGGFLESRMEMIAKPFQMADMLERVEIMLADAGTAGPHAPA
ncbi:MAG: ATP-binding protein [Massilia sp.]